MRDKVIIRFNGGLGNQMFQWEFGSMLEETRDAEVYYDMSYFAHNYARAYQLNIFNIEPKFVQGDWLKFKLDVIWTFRGFLESKKFFGTKLISEKQFNFDPHLGKIENDTYVDGFFQSDLYFNTIEYKLRQDFKFITPMTEGSMQVASKIRSRNSISLHIRRGDYVQKPRYQKMYAECSLDYYKRGVEYIAKNYEDPPTLFIFSDDIEWVRANLKLPYRMIFVSHNTGKNSYEDMRLMSLCTNNIIANSSFSWWAAWLNNNKEKIVIAPKKWFNDDNIVQTDVIPNSWVRIDN